MTESPRRLLALVGGLPQGAAVWREERLGWTQQDELLATCIELVDAWGRQLVSALVAVNGGRVGDLGEPMRVRHPDRPEPESAGSAKRSITTDPGQIAAFLRSQVS